jgi:transcriptional regulator with GAF, ATPase, and Fis domain
MKLLAPLSCTPVTLPYEAQLAATFVELADTLIDDFDVIEFLHLLTGRCVELLEASAAGLMLADSTNELRVMASSSERARLLELYELQNAEGPCLECYRTGMPVAIPDLDREEHRWPRFAVEARDAGFRAVQALPMRLRRTTIGALNLFRSDVGVPSHNDLLVAQALADVATIGILQERTVREAQTTTAQLQTALDSRIAIEQAKGVIAQRARVDMDEAFRALRGYARRRHYRLSDLARAVVRGTIDVDEVAQVDAG